MFEKECLNDCYDFTAMHLLDSCVHSSFKHSWWEHIAALRTLLESVSEIETEILNNQQIFIHFFP